MRAGEGIVRAGEGAKKKQTKFAVIISSFNVEINEYDIKKPRFNGVYLINNLPKKIKKEHT